MPKTFTFRLHERNSHLPPDEAQYSSLDEAIEDAISAARELISDDVLADGRINLNRQFEISNEHGEVCAVVAFSEAVKLEH